MKIAILSHKLTPPLIGGVDVYTIRLGRALKRLGHEIVYLAFDSTGETKEVEISREDLDRTALWRIHFAFDHLPKRAFDTVYNPVMGEAARELFEIESPGLVIIVNFYMITLAPVEAAKSLGIPVAHVATDFVPVCRRGTFMRWNDQTCVRGESVQHCANCFISHRTLGRLAAGFLDRLPEETIVEWASTRDAFRLPDPRWAARPYLHHAAVMTERLDRLGTLRSQIDLVMVPTRFTYDTFIANGFRPGQVHLLPFGVEPDSPLAVVETSPSDHVRFLFLGRLQPYKGCHLLVEAFNRLEHRRGATLTIYGAPDKHDKYFDRLKSRMDAGEGIHFAGLIPPDELGKAFAEADIFVLPSTWHENCPLILLDALQSGTPVIGSDAGGIRGIVEHEVNGLLVEMGSVESLQSAMQRVINDSHLVQSLKAGKELVTIDHYAKVLLCLMEKKAA